jgi:hypothetical protein
MRSRAASKLSRQSASRDPASRLPAWGISLHSAPASMKKLISSVLS